ncbi:preprotein translocase subunit SecY [Sphingobacterium sp. SGG-5]|uniref:preprotein translocase subunit SecY n=1 Tax=Sphingobacterium sp. SGG-5 TaxID=2710881 RepID=UPI0013EB3CFE|nr:preprotein translocase subunit SecY [Sphingobacterium sp. SGG-5]NGM62548.1 preprotein translocase subunit SecY [Sphingobacterium sp. SGG-5]
MKKLITTLTNIWKIEDLRNRIINTLLFLLIYRIGCHVVLPGVNPEALVTAGQKEGLLGIINMFSGGSFSRSAIFALGVMPYISASIVIQLLGIAVPAFQKMQKEGESGRTKMNQITRYLTLAITLVQAVAYVKTQIEPSARIIADPMFTILSSIVLTAGTLFVMWLGEKITDKGIGNGISLIIMVGIIAQLPAGISSEWASRMSPGGGGIIPLLLEFIALFFVVIFTILIVQGVRKVPVQYAKKIVGNKQVGGVRQYIPLKVNAAGVMPIIFAQAIMFLPMSLSQFFPGLQSDFLASLSNFTSVPYNITFAILIIAFTFFYTAIMVNPQQMSEDMKKNGGFIPGIKPGHDTNLFIDNVISRITFPGAIFVAIVAILPAIASVVGVNNQFAHFYGGTSLLIMVGVVLDTLQQIESHLLMRHYDGLMKTGRVKGRSTASVEGYGQSAI